MLAVTLTAGGCGKPYFEEISPDYSKGRSIRANEDDVVIHVSSCTPDKRVLYGDFGATMLAVRGPEKEGCHILYVTEMEQSGWQWDEAKTCVVPAALARVVMSTLDSRGLDTSPLIDYCSPAFILK